MTFTLHVHASPPAEAAHPADVVATGAAIRLRDAISADYDISFTGSDGSPREVRVVVSFPDEARSLLQELTWRQARSIVDTVFEIGAAYAAQSVASRLGGVGLSTDAGATRIPIALYMPIGSFRDGLEAIRGSAAVM